MNPSRVLVELLVGEQLEEAADREEWSTQLVGGVRDELLASVVELRELNAHLVERAGQLPDLVVALIDDRGTEVTTGDALLPPLPTRQPPARASRPR